MMKEVLLDVQELLGEAIINIDSRIDNVEHNSLSSIIHLEERVIKLENFLKKIMPLLPDEIKLYLELAEDEGE